ncbi:MAG: cholesterol oxidase [Solirubrobacteraceae bacterium]|nr:cholesterol oxidase [Solirubrobacteraceae bacterium]
MAGMGGDHFDAVIVGSGFGGSVTAQRLAEAGLRVCVLERGKPYPPGSFPRSPLAMSKNFWDPSAGLHGMYNVWSFDGLDALVSSGLGGGSLIYANVMLRKDEKWFVVDAPVDGDGYETWPVTRADLDPHYDRVEAMMDATPYPLAVDPYASTPKTLAFRAAAEEVAAERPDLGMSWQLPNLAVTFAPGGADGKPAAPGEPIAEDRPNLHGRTRLSCLLVGECDIGCNYGAKNTLDYNYLTAAWHDGADIRTLCEVRRFEPREGGGYSIQYVRHADDGEERDTGQLPLETVTADRLVLSAGTLGSTYLLLANHAAFPKLSRRLGARFSGNGDLLTFALRCTQLADGGARAPRVIEPAHGPVITSAARVAGAEDGFSGRGFYIEDAGFPEFCNWMLHLVESPSALTKAAPLLFHLVSSWLHGPRESDVGAEISDLFGDCSLSAGMLPLLGMGRDVPDGHMSLRGGRLEVDWRKHGASKEYFERVHEVSEALADKLGATFQDNPIWHLNRVITVHALGGCSMGRTIDEGVVSAVNGEVFGYPGLHVADGSVMPGPVGANPSLTIAAVADRFADAILEGRGDADAPRAAPAPAPSPVQTETPVAAAVGGGDDDEAVSVSFTEEMKGFVAFGEDDFDRGFRAGRESKTALMFHLTITAEDIERFVADRDHFATAEGYVESDALGGRLPVTRGDCNLFVDQHKDRPSKRMLYRLHFADGTGRPLTLTGFKVVEDDPGFDAWRDTTTLFTRVLEGHVEPTDDGTAEVVATGIIHIHVRDFAKQLTTFRVHPAARVDALGRFGALFAGDLWDVYGPHAGAAAGS